VLRELKRRDEADQLLWETRHLDVLDWWSGYLQELPPKMFKIRRRIISQDAARSL